MITFLFNEKLPSPNFDRSWLDFWLNSVKYLTDSSYRYFGDYEFQIWNFFKI